MHLSSDHVKGKCGFCGGLVIVRASQGQTHAVCSNCHEPYPEYDTASESDENEPRCPRCGSTRTIMSGDVERCADCGR